MLWRFRRKHVVPINRLGHIDYTEKIIAHMRQNDKLHMSFFEYLQQVLGVEYKWSWWHRDNCFVFATEEDYLLFVLKVS